MNLFLMQLHRQKTTYHPFLLIAFHLNCLPDNELLAIPRSTRFDWVHRDFQDSERAIRPVTLYRKNSLFAGNENGAKKRQSEQQAGSLHARG